MTAHLSIAAIISSLLVIPFVILEWVNGQAFEKLPIALFAFLWLLGFSFTLILMNSRTQPVGGPACYRP